ncbi:MAG: helix-turn-helix domain-containing protein, partial [Steroidobacteraceae bacterium]
MPSNRPKSGSPQAPSLAARGDSTASPWRASRERLRDREIKRDAVIRAAARAFNRKGYHNTSLDDIAAALEVTKPTVYYYVSNKEQLLFECFV